ncbi:MAG TPA: ATP-binding protein [Paucimonas sp.]|nr:ATP-binding protein [Paucimonas sp.]HJW55938.1 ATP-binding protein [Burkholderiaceae bacterium]
MNHRILTVAINSEHDVVEVRRRARHIASLLGFGAQDQARIAAAVSEIARNAFVYASGGRAEFVLDALPPSLIISIKDAGKGIADLADILDGHYHSSTGLGMGILGARRLMDRCDIETCVGRGTTVTLRKLLPDGLRVGKELLAGIADGLAAAPAADSAAETQLQNKELLRTLSELRGRQDELLSLTRELEDTNRGVVALYAEIEEKAEHLRRADEMKSKFLSNTSHELRTPLGSIRALAQLLLDRMDGDLTPEQEKQVMFIQRAATDLSELVDDLLDMAKIESGKTDVNVSKVSVNALFSMLRGMLRPLGMRDSVELVFDEAEPDMTLYTDEGKVSQILRNLISNALKFTNTGEVRVSVAACNPAENKVRFSVVDTGIGIAEGDLQRIFEEFSQIENALQKGVRGTGLGLPLCCRLATLLGGAIEVQSTPGIGSVFSLTLPLHAGAEEPPPEGIRRSANPDNESHPSTFSGVGVRQGGRAVPPAPLPM